MSRKIFGINNGFFSKAYSNTVKYNASKRMSDIKQPTENYDYHRENFF